MHAQTGQRFGQFRRMNRIRQQRPALIERPAGAMVMVGNHHAVDRLGGMAGPPANHDAAQIVLIQDVPERFRFSREVGDRLHAAAIRRGLGEAVNAVLEWPLSGGDGSPQHRRKRRMQRGDLSRRRRFLPGAGRWAFCPASISGWMTFQSAASQPTRRTLRRAMCVHHCDETNLSMINTKCCSGRAPGGAG